MELKKAARGCGQVSGLWRRTGARVATLCVLVCGGVVSASGAAGTFDPAWGGAGIVVAPTSGGHLAAVAAQADGKVIAAGFETTGATDRNGAALTQWVVRRFAPSGTPDMGFGTSGVVRLFGSYPGDEALDCAVDSAGRIVVVGLRGVATNNRGAYATLLAVARFTATGTLDMSFGAGGVVQPGFSGFTLGRDGRVVTQTDGRIVIGTLGTYSKKAQGKTVDVACLAAIRYLASGAPDTSFDGDGLAFQGLSGPSVSFGRGRTVGIQSDGGIVVGGNVSNAGLNPAWTVARFQPTGAADTSFGVVTGPVGENLHSLRIDAADRIVAAGRRAQGSAGADALVRRYGPGGSLDTTFAQSGEFLSAVAGTDYAGDVAIQSDGSIVLALTAETSPGSQVYDFAPMRLLDSGLVDSSYGTGGIGPNTGMPSVGTWAWSVAILPNGDAVIGGRAPASPTAWVIAEYLP